MSIPNQLAAVRHAINQSCQTAGREPAAVTLLAVSKTFGAEAVIVAADAGQVAFGENYLQEAVNKIAKVHKLRPELSLEW